MKLTMKLFLIISLFCSTSFANGDIHNGHKDGSTCSECPGNFYAGNEEKENSLLDIIQNYLIDLLG